MAETFERLIVEIDVRDVDVAGVERIGVDREAVVVRSDFDTLGDFIDDRVIGAAMSEFQFVSLAAERETEDLVAEADTEDGGFADEIADIVDLRMQAARDRRVRWRGRRHRASAKARLRRK